MEAGQQGALLLVCHRVDEYTWKSQYYNAAQGEIFGAVHDSRNTKVFGKLIDRKKGCMGLSVFVRLLFDMTLF